MNPFFVTDFSISDSLKTVRKSVLIYETIILSILYPSNTNLESGCCENESSNSVKAFS